MKVIGIVCEYNPFHLGHLYQLKKVKEIYPNSIIITICSSYFTQRGDVSVMNKWDKAKVALSHGSDLFIELPFAYATQSSDIFAKGALQILNYLKIDTLVFGSESDDVNSLINLAKIQLKNNNYDELVKKYLKQGYNYPTALSKSLEKISNIKINQPNDLLALSYIKEIIKNNYKITPITIKRTNDYHQTSINETNIISANLIRKELKNNNSITKYIPYNTNQYIKKISLDLFYPFLKYQIINNSKNLNKILTVDEGIENRIIKNINKCDNYNDLIMEIKTKRYTYNKINRMLLHILTNFTKEEAQNIEINYIRLLGFTLKGQQYLNSIKKDIKIPIITRYKPNISLLLDIELRVSTIYSYITNSNDLITLEYAGKPIILTTTNNDINDINW